ncbi:MAG: replicative DNA helicase [Planctomycetes bacterium]|nr:replicative DNA helicase [Planctomycetota bacterium]
MVSVDASILDELTAKTLPHHREAEEAVLGALLQDREAVSEVAQHLKAEDFYVVAHQVLFHALVRLFEAGSGVDLTIVGEALQKTGDLDRVGGPLALARLVERVPSSANVAYHAAIVRERALRRGLIEAARRILEDARTVGRSIEEIVDGAEQVVFDVARRNVRGESVPLRTIVKEVLLALDQRAAGELAGIRSHYPDLDERLSGLQGGQLLIVAARPSMGKTSFALNIALRAATRSAPPTPTLVFSLEMPRQQIAQNILSCHAQVDSHLLRKGMLDHDAYQRVSQSAAALEFAPIYIDDTPGMTSLQIRAKARRMKASSQIGLVVVDYLQLIASPRAIESRQQEISQISIALKELARELEVPVIAISQLNRAVDNREDHRPRMSDLRESGSIEQDADVVLFLFREDYYDGGKNPQTQNKATLIIAKNRNGPIGDVPLSFFPENVRFEPYSDLDFRG